MGVNPITEINDMKKTSFYSTPKEQRAEQKNGRRESRD